MGKKFLKMLPTVVISILLGIAIAIAGGQGGIQYSGIPVFVICGLAAFIVNWIVFIPSNMAKTEHYFDLTGSLTYITVISLALWLSGNFTMRSIIAALLVYIWAIRLGSFLFARIKRDGKDGRFDAIKPNAFRFFSVWTLQGLWVLLTSACALAIITGGVDKPLGPVGMTGIGLWVMGFGLEVFADRQKSEFKKDPDHQGQFINTGLWRWSRHPNYFGEIMLWTGMALLAGPVLNGWQWVVLISPLFVYFLLTRLSGIPTLEKRAFAKWGDDPEYRTYLRNTPRLILKPPKKA